MPNTIHQTYFYAHKPETIWEFLTTAELLEQWLMPNDFKPIVGHEFRFTTKPLPALDFDGVCHCKVTEVIPLKKLSYSWKGGPGDGSISLDTLVQWFLQEKNDGTELRLEHSGFDETNNINIYNGMNDGWNKILQRLSEKINLAKNGTTNA